MIERYSVGTRDDAHNLGAGGGVRSAVAFDNLNETSVRFEEIPETLLADTARFRFQQDNRRFKDLDCESLCLPIDFGKEAGTAFAVFKNIDRELLCDFADRLPTKEKVELAIDLVEGLVAVHELGIVHRNLHVGSAFVVDGNAMLGGLGVERFINPSGLSQEKSLRFARYASPELAGSLIYDIGPASDLYSIGVILFRLFTGNAPFLAGSVSEVLFQHLTTDPQFSHHARELPTSLVRIIEILLRKDPPERYQSAESLVSDLRSVLALMKEGKSTKGFVVCSREVKPAVSDPAFVGRQNEFDSLAEELTRINSLGARKVLVSCPSGIGKSRLILEFMRHATRKNVTVLTGRGSDEAGREPMAPLLSVIQQLSKRLIADSESHERLRESLEEEKGAIASVCPEFAKVMGWNQSNLGSCPDEFGQNRVEKAVAKLLEGAASAEMPLMIWIDDCQWLDEQTLKILSIAGGIDTRNLLFLFSMRSEDTPVVGNFCDNVQPDKRVELGPLSDEEVCLLQKSMTGPLPDSAATTVIKHAAGSPFMAAAVIRGMFEANAIKLNSEGVWKIDKDALSKIQAADDAAQVLVQRLNQLPQSTMRLLSIAALIGKEFEVQSVVEISELDELGEHLEAARRNRLIWSMPNGSISFVHDKIREALLQCLGAEEKRGLHLRLAEYFESHRPRQVFDIAFHFERAQYPGRALHYAIEAAKIARKRFALLDTEEQLKIALNGMSEANAATRYEVYSLFADVTLLDGRYEQAESWLDHSAEFAKTAIEKGHVVLARGELQFKRGNKEAAVKCFEQALDDLGYKTPRFVTFGLAVEAIKQTLHSVLPKVFVGRGLRGVRTATEKDRLACRVLSRLAHGYWYTRDKYQTLWAHLRSMNLAEKFLPTPELAQAYSEHSPVMSLLPWHSRGLKYADLSLAMRKEFGDIWGQGQSRNFKSILLYSSSEFEKAISQSRRAISVLERTGDYWEVHVARYQLAASHYRMGDLKSAVRESQEAYKSALELEDYQATGNILDVWARASLSQIPAQVIELERQRALGDMQGQCQILLADGVRNIGNGNYEDAAGRFRDAIAHAKKAGVLNTYITPNYPWLATSLRLIHENAKHRSISGTKETATQFLRAAKKAVRVSISFQNDLPHSLRELGLAYSNFSKSTKAKRALLESIEVAVQQGASYELAQSQHVLAELKSELRWQDVEYELTDTEFEICEIENQVAPDQAATSLSIWDRFENLLEAGQRISRATTKRAIERACIESANLLLRSQRSALLQDFNAPLESNTEFDLSIARLAVKERAAVVSDRETLSNLKAHQCDGSYLASPVMVKGKTLAVLYAANDAVHGLFGEREKRIAEFLTATAGAAFEKAENYRSLEKMNKELEERVANRTGVVRARSIELEKTADTLRETQRSLEKAKDSAERANNTKSVFLARMSHEIRTPIAAINGFTELLLRGIIPPEERREKLLTILDSGKHLLRLINNLLDLSKVEANQLEIESIDVNPADIVHGVLESLRSKAIEKSIGLDMEIVGSIPSAIKTDETRFRQVVTNLVGNAVKFTLVGFVTVRIAMESIDDSTGVIAENESENVLIVDVIDSGIGMTEEQMANIFDPFSQADTSVTRRFGGTGLGLSISKDLMVELGGRIEVNSTPNEGSCFRLSLPVSGADGGGLIDKGSFKSTAIKDKFELWHPTDLAGKRVLVVDDAPTNREFLKLILGETHAEIVTAENGQEAVDVLKGECFDLVLMDMQMPILDGYSATRKIREFDEEVPIVALTANSMKDDDQTCLNAGCTDYLSKPLDTVALLKTIANHVLCEATNATVEEKVYSNKKGTVSVSMSDRMATLSAEYVRSLETQLGEFQIVVKDQNTERIASLGHAMKGTAGMVGLSELSDAGTRLEQAGLDRQWKTATETVAEIEDLVRAAVLATSSLVTNS